MLLSIRTTIKWNAKTQKWYVAKGYSFTRMGDSFEVDVCDLTSGSNAVVNVRCDYCGRIFNKQWHRYLKENKMESIHKDCCSKCKAIKIQEKSLATYGVKSVLSLPQIRQKAKNTLIEEYGVANPFQSAQIIEKIRTTMHSRYGYPYATQSPVIKQKTAVTCMSKYGVATPLLLIPNSGPSNSRWKGGVKHHRQERATLEYINWRRHVYERDSYTCQCCGDHNGAGHSVALQAHHIANWKDNPTLRYDVDNGITMCIKCHTLFHIVYGKKNNTTEQLIMFVSDMAKRYAELAETELPEATDKKPPR